MYCNLRSKCVAHRGLAGLRICPYGSVVHLAGVDGGDDVAANVVESETGRPDAGKKMMWIMPFMFAFTFFSSPAGLVLYWVVSNIFHCSTMGGDEKKYGQ